MTPTQRTLDRPEVISFTIYGKPEQRGSKQAHAKYDKDGKPITKNGRVLTFAKDGNAKSKDWMNSVRSAAAEVYQGELIAGPVRLSVVFFFPRPKNHFGTGKNATTLKPSAPEMHAQSPDLDKLVRCLSDGLTGMLFLDDRQIYEIHAERRWTTRQARAEVSVGVI